MISNFLNQALNGFEPSISCLQDSRINHYATEPEYYDQPFRYIERLW